MYLVYNFKKNINSQWSFHIGRVFFLCMCLYLSMIALLLKQNFIRKHKMPFSVLAKFALNNCMSEENILFRSHLS